MSPDRLQLQRFELKYVISERLTPAVQDFLRAYLTLDENAAARPNYSYPIHSLYLDSDTLALYWDTINGTKNRYKLRLRFYEDLPDAPVFFEIKRRTNDAILKQRGAVRRQAVGLILAGHPPESNQLLSDDPRQLVALQRFSQLMLGLRARPKVHVAYWREAWVSTSDNSVRVTMDRQVPSAPEFTARLRTEMHGAIPVFGPQVVLEIKFTARFPVWFGELVRVFGLERRSAAKYADGVSLLGEDRLRPPPVAWSPTAPIEAATQPGGQPKIAEETV